MLFYFIVFVKKVGRILNIFYVIICVVWGIDGGYIFILRWMGDDFE